MSESKIIALDADPATPLVRRRPIDYAACRHLYFDLVVDLRRVECRQCGETLDAFDALLNLCTRYTERDYKYRAIEEFEKREEEKRVKLDTKRRERLTKRMAAAPPADDAEKT